MQPRGSGALTAKARPAWCAKIAAVARPRGACAYSTKRCVTKMDCAFRRAIPSSSRGENLEQSPDAEHSGNDGVRPGLIRHARTCSGHPIGQLRLAWRANWIAGKSTAMAKQRRRRRQKDTAASALHLSPAERGRAAATSRRRRGEGVKTYQRSYESSGAARSAPVACSAKPYGPSRASRASRQHLFP